MGSLLAVTADDVIAGVVIVLLFLVAPILLLWARDKGHLKTAWGILSFLAGLVIVAAVFEPLIFGEGRTWDNSDMVALAIAGVLLYLGVRWVRRGGPGIDHLPPDFQCPELEASIRNARKTLPWFQGQVDRNVDGAYIKFPLKMPNGNVEHIWGYVHSFRDDAFNVSLANTPYDGGESVQGRRDVPRTEVEDWQILLPDGRIRGAYSVRALFEHFESRGKLTWRMREQRRQLIDDSENVDA